MIGTHGFSRNNGEAARRLQHPGIVEIHEVGEAEGLPYFVMSFVDGPNLADLVRDHPLEPRRAARLVARVAEALQSAHERGILHRDLKPSNVLLGPDDCPKITDFGLAVAEWMAQGLTRTGETLGSPAYLAPEQISAHRGEVRPASDIYALGAVLYHLLTGRPPFMAATTTDTLEQVLRREVLAPRRLNPLVPLELEAICLRCLASISQSARSEQELRDQLQRKLGSLTYAHQIVAAQRAWEMGELTAARRWLGATDAAYRGWEHAYLEALLNRQHLRLEGHLNPVSQVVFHPSGNRLVSVGWDLTLRVWSLPEGREQHQLAAHAERPLAVAFSGDGRLLATGEKSAVLRLPEARPSALALGPEGRRFAGGTSNGRVFVMDAGSDTILWSVHGHVGVVSQLAWSADGRRLVTCRRDGSLRIWDSEFGSELLTIRDLFDDGFAVAWSHQDRYLAATDRSGRIWLIDLGCPNQWLLGSVNSANNPLMRSSASW